MAAWWRFRSSASVLLEILFMALTGAAERDAQRPPPTATPAEATDCKITPDAENGKRGGGSLEQKVRG